MKILIADDNSEVRSAMRLLLEQDPLPIEIMEASDTQNLIALLMENCPKAVLLDWELSGFLGIDF